MLGAYFRALKAAFLVSTLLPNSDGRVLSP